MSTNLLNIVNRQELVALGLSALGGAATVARHWVQAHLAPKKLATIEGLARDVVLAAEKVGAVLQLDGPQKYAYAENALIEGGQRVGFNLTPTEANSFIHSALAVFEGVVPGSQDTVNVSAPAA